MINTWLLVNPDDEGNVIEIDTDEQFAVRSRIWRQAGALRPDPGSDWEMLSRHFHVAVYEWSVTENMPLNFPVRRGDKCFPLSGPVLVYKTDDRGESVNLTDDDAWTLRSYIRQQRAGLIIDSRLLG